MKLLLKAAGIFLTIFITLLIIMHFAGVYSQESLQTLLQTLYSIASWKVILCIVFLLVIDLFVTIPTMGTIMVAGLLLGPFMGGITASIGLLMAGTIGYSISRKYGALLLHKLSKDPKEVTKAKALFLKNGMLVLLFGRAAPMLPELSSCLAGMSGMPYKKYFFWYTLGSVPYSFTLAYFGSKTSLEDPLYALLIMLTCSGSMALIWLLIKRGSNRNQHKS